MKPLLIEDSSTEERIESPFNECPDVMMELEPDLLASGGWSPEENSCQVSIKEPVAPSSPKNEELVLEDSAKKGVKYSKLQKKVKKFRVALKEYKILVNVIEKENEKYREQTIKSLEIITKLKRSKKKARDFTLSWVNKFRFQRVKVKALKKKVKALEACASSLGTKLKS